MRPLAAFILIILGLTAVHVSVAVAGTWRLVMPDTLRVDGGVVRLADLSQGPVPAGVADLVIHSGGRPNSMVSLSRQGILRRLVNANLASGVRFTGAQTSHLVFDGQSIRENEIEDAVRKAVQPLVPGSEPGAPATWFELDLSPLSLSTDGSWKITVEDPDMLQPGRNLVTCILESNENVDRFPVAILVHRYGEVATVTALVDRNSALHVGLFTWDWKDLADTPSGLAIGRGTLEGQSLTRDLKAGSVLRTSDLEKSSVIQAGDTVDLLVIRGQVAVTVRAQARQPGCLGQTIPVRNTINGRLVNALVTGPGLVEWRR
jgi:flagella basal body P-ring formation protein FlgA